MPSEISAFLSHCDRHRIVVVIHQYQLARTKRAQAVQRPVELAGQTAFRCDLAYHGLAGAFADNGEISRVQRVGEHEDGARSEAFGLEQVFDHGGVAADTINLGGEDHAIRTRFLGGLVVCLKRCEAVFADLRAAAVECCVGKQGTGLDCRYLTVHGAALIAKANE
jgi:hypothetical protein